MYTLLFITAAAVGGRLAGATVGAPECEIPEERKAAAAIVAMGGTVNLRDGRVLEVGRQECLGEFAKRPPRFWG